jgi:hypothetical protein
MEEPTPGDPVCSVRAVWGAQLPLAPVVPALAPNDRPLSPDEAPYPELPELPDIPEVPDPEAEPVAVSPPLPSVMA